MSTRDVENINGCIYMIVNTKNKMRYIGRDINNNPQYLGGGLYLRKEQRKYGRDKFFKIILCKCKTLKELLEKEQYYLDLYDASNNKKFYNRDGDANHGGREIVKPVHQYDKNGNYIQAFENATKAARYMNVDHRNISRAVKRENGSSYGFYWTLKKYDKLNLSNIKIKLKVRKYTKRIRIYQYDLNGNYIRSYKTIKDAAMKYNDHCSNIWKAVNGVYTKSVGYFWLKKYYKKIPKNKLDKLKMKGKGQHSLRSVVALDLKYNLIKSYKKMTDAANELNVDKRHIYRVCNNPSNSTHGYKFMYYNNYLKLNKIG